MELELKKKGDLITPKGTFKVINVFYRPDKLNKIKSGIPVFEIKRKYRWCTDPRNHNYNSLIVGKTNCTYENLYREDDIYDLVVVLNYNLRKKSIKVAQSLFTANLRKINLLRVALELKKNNLCK